jgi:hypothetical protein
MKTTLKKMAAIILAATTLAVGTTGLSASAADASLSINTSSATLYNTSGATRYGNVNFTVINRSTGAHVKSVGNSGNIANYASLTASKGGYSAVSYRFTANASLYKGTSAYSGVLWSGTAQY